MSVKIDLNKPLSDAEIQYLESRGRRGDILKNRRQFATSEQSASETTPNFQDRRAEGSASTEQADWDELVEEMNVEELREELTDRNLDTTGKKADLQRRLKDAGPPQD